MPAYWNDAAGVGRIKLGAAPAMRINRASIAGSSSLTLLDAGLHPWFVLQIHFGIARSIAAIVGELYFMLSQIRNGG